MTRSRPTGNWRHFVSRVRQRGCLTHEHEHYTTCRRVSFRLRENYRPNTVPRPFRRAAPFLARSDRCHPFRRRRLHRDGPASARFFDSSQFAPQTHLWGAHLGVIVISAGRFPLQRKPLQRVIMVEPLLGALAVGTGHVSDTLCALFPCRKSLSSKKRAALCRAANRTKPQMKKGRMEMSVRGGEERERGGNEQMVNEDHQHEGTTNANPGRLLPTALLHYTRIEWHT